MTAKHPDAKVEYVMIHCPECGWTQKVERVIWDFQHNYGHGHTCGSGKCPSHTFMRLDEKEVNSKRCICDLKKSEPRCLHYWYSGFYPVDEEACPTVWHQDIGCTCRGPVEKLTPAQIKHTFRRGCCEYRDLEKVVGNGAE